MFSCPVSVPRSSRRAVAGTLRCPALASKIRDGVPPKSAHRAGRKADAWAGVTGFEGLMLDLPLTMHPHTQHRQQLFGIDRLSEIIRGASLEAFFPVALHGFGG